MFRIKKIAEYIHPFKIIADIGCDHGFLIKEAILNQGITKAYAIDNKKMPLENAKKNLSNYPNIEYILSDGLESITPDTEVIIIAGMGGMLITKILSKNIDKLKNIKRIIVQANRNNDKVRKLLLKHNYLITNEAIIEEDNKYYEIDVFEKGNMTYSLNEIIFGPILLKEKNPIFIKKWKKQISILESFPILSIETKHHLQKIKEILNED